MTSKVHILTPEDTIEDAAKKMEKEDVGSLLVGENDRLVGIVTDRDIVTRGAAKGLKLSDPIKKVMTPKVLYCYDDEAIEEIVENLGRNQIHRLPVLSREKRLVGIISLGDLSVRGAKEHGGVALHKIKQGLRS